MSVTPITAEDAERLGRNAHKLARHPDDVDRLRRTYTALAEAKRAASAVQTTGVSEPVQRSVTAAKSFARFLPDGKRHKPDSCNAANVWGRAGKGVL